MSKMADKDAHYPTGMETLEVPAHSALERSLLVGGRTSKTKPKFEVPPPNTELLSRLQTFLPQLNEANREINNTNENCFENPTEPGGAIVELNLECGVFDLKDEAAVAAAERTMATGPFCVESYRGDEDSENDTSDNEISQGSDVHDGGENTDGRGNKSSVQNNKCKQKHPGIEELT